MQTFLGVHDAKIKGTLSGFDRVRFRGTLRMLANTKGLSCVLTCVESCKTFTIHKNAEEKILELRPIEGRCLHQYFYFQHPLFGFMQLRLQTWAPFTVHVNINGREWLAGQMQDADISYEKRDNCFTDVGDLVRAQALLDEQLRTHWDRILGDLIRECHPVHAASPMFQREPYYWSADETEWATDVMFRSREDLAEVYPGLVRHSVTHVGCQNVLHYLGRSGTVAKYSEAEITTSVLTRHEGTRCKHTINSNPSRCMTSRRACSGSRPPSITRVR